MSPPVNRLGLVAVRAARTIGPPALDELPLGGRVVREHLRELNERDALPVGFARPLGWFRCYGSLCLSFYHNAPIV